MGDGFGALAADQAFVRLGEDAVALPDTAIDADELHAISGEVAQGRAGRELRNSRTRIRSARLPGDSDPVH